MPRWIALFAVIALALPAAAEMSREEARALAEGAAEANAEVASGLPQFAPVHDMFRKQCAKEFKTEDRKSRGKFCNCGADIAMAVALDDLLNGNKRRQSDMRAMSKAFAEAGEPETYEAICRAAFL